MPVTHPLIGTGITMRDSTNISAPFGEEEDAALRDMLEAIGQESTFEGIAASWEVLCQNVFDKTQLPPRNKLVRVYSDGNWADDIPEDWVQRSHKPRHGEVFGFRQTVIECRYGVDSPEWFADRILQLIAVVRKEIARGATATAAHMAL